MTNYHPDPQRAYESHCADGYVVPDDETGPQEATTSVQTVRAKRHLTCDNRDAATRRWNSEWPLTRSSDFTREGLAMKATRDIPCVPWKGSEKRHQERAALELEFVGRTPALWSWITAACDTPLCIEPEHLRIHAPLTLAYPSGICVYCGRRAATKDHLLPRNWTGDSARHFVVTVPACGTCNSILRDTITTSITERRALCHVRLRKHFRKVLRTIEYGPTDLAEFGPTLREYVETEMEKKAAVMAMLEWPTDPAYDMRALQHSGIEDPWVLGLILADDDRDMLRRVQAVA